MRVKSLIILIAIIIVLGALVTGTVYLSKKKKQERAFAQFNLAQTLLKKQDNENALKQLEELYENYPNYPFAKDVNFFLIKLLYDTEKHSESLEYCDTFLERFAESDLADEVLYYKGRIFLDRKDNAEQAGATFNQLLKEYPESNSKNKALFGLSQIKYEKGEFKEAKKQLDALMEKDLDEEIQHEAENLLGNINLELLLSLEINEEDILYEIKKGDTIYDLARKYNVTQELILRCNKISDPRYLSIGKRIKIPKVDFSILVNKSNNTLILLSGGKFFKKYAVRTGEYEHQTPVGEFKIENKKKDPEWYNPRDHKRYPAGDPNNELGTRWMSFYLDKLGIHGTIHPETIGQYASYGCVGMLKEDVEELYDLVPIGTPVKIIGKRKSN